MRQIFTISIITLVKRLENEKSDADKLNFWTKEEYDCFISGIDWKSKYFVNFEILFGRVAERGGQFMTCGLNCLMIKS